MLRLHPKTRSHRPFGEYFPFPQPLSFHLVRHLCPPQIGMGKITPHLQDSTVFEVRTFGSIRRNSNAMLPQVSHLIQSTKEGRSTIFPSVQLWAPSNDEPMIGIEVDRSSRGSEKGKGRKESARDRSLDVPWKYVI